VFFRDDKRKIGGLLLMLRAGLVIAGAIGFMVAIYHRSKFRLLVR